MSTFTKSISYKVKSFPIIFTLNPNSLDPAVLSSYPKLFTGDVQYQPEFKELNLTDINDVVLNPIMQEYGSASWHKETFVFPEIVGQVGVDKSKQVRAARQRNFEKQVLISPLDSSRVRKLYSSVGIHMVSPLSDEMELEPFMIIYNGVSQDPLILRNLISKSFNVLIYQVSNPVLRYLFT